MIGRSSAINSHSLVFPNRDMHDTWARIIGDEKWSWEQMKDCYTRFYDLVEAPASTTSTNLEKMVSIEASHPQEPNQLQRAWEEVFTALSMKSQSDGPSGRCFGGFTTTNAIDSQPGKGKRSHAGNAYLKPAIGRDNLMVETNAMVDRVLLEKGIWHIDGDWRYVRKGWAEITRQGQERGHDRCWSIWQSATA